MSADTILLTPNTRNNLRSLRAAREDMVAILADVSDQSIVNGSVNDSVGISDTVALECEFTIQASQYRAANFGQVSHRGPPHVLQDPQCGSNTFQTMETRGRTSPSGLETSDAVVSTSKALNFSPKSRCNSIVVNKPCYLTHPGMGDKAMAEGRTGGSWRAKAQKFGNLCQQGEQMVQIHKVLVPNIRLLQVEARQLFEYLDDAVMKSTGSNVFVKWDCKYLHKKSI
ncbi:hypothetical protein M758_UG303400 [Ceratodon purpureus]|nr:hypothetical protein M758_UG303400 [Ceratodon purpureus]